jgi:hypothetical protein
MKIRIKKPPQIDALPCLVERSGGGIWLAVCKDPERAMHYKCVKIYGRALEPTLGVGEIAKIHIDSLSVCSCVVELSN